MNILKSFTLLSLATSLLLAAPADKQQQELDYITKTGEESSDLLIKTLGKNLKSKMKNGGVMKALEFCSNEAYTITENVNTKLPKGVSVKRISTNYRSPANTPKENEEAILNSLEELNKLNVMLPKEIIEKVDVDTYKYYKPLVINNEVCLKCHGKLEDIDLRRAITQRYPLDKATNYKMNDLRGAVVVTIKRK